MSKTTVFCSLILLEEFLGDFNGPKMSRVISHSWALNFKSEELFSFKTIEAPQFLALYKLINVGLYKETWIL